MRNFRDSTTATVPAYISEFLVDISDFFLVASTAWSFFTVVRGQLSHICYKKDGFVPLMGKMVLVAFYATTTFARAAYTNDISNQFQIMKKAEK